MKLNLLLLFSIITQPIFSQDARIIGGFTVEPEFKYSWMVAIFRYGEYWCGGTLLKSNKVLTAAHCMGGTIAPLEDYEVHIHRHDLTKSVEEEGGKVYKVTKRWIPINYTREKLYDDVAVIELDNNSTERSSIVLNKKDNYKDGFQVTALGWGAIQVGQAPHPILQEVSLPLTNKGECNKVYRQKLNYTILSTQICTGNIKGKKDTCRGDSGGPLFTYINDRPTLIGITSNGISCAKPNTPAVYTKIAKFTNWINNILKGRIKESETTELFP